MVIVIHTTVGEGSYNYIKPLFVGKRTLFVGSKPVCRAVCEYEWRELDIQCIRPWNNPDGSWDQVFFDQVPLNTRRQRANIVKLVSRFHTIIFRPRKLGDEAMFMGLLHGLGRAF